MQCSQENTYGGFIKKRIQHRYFLVNIAKFRIIPILKNICKWLPLYILTDLELVIKYWADLILIKKITECFLLRRYVDLVRVYSLLIIRNHYNTFLLTDLQNNKNFSKVKYFSKGYLFWYHDFDKFRQVVVYYLVSILMICK